MRELTLGAALAAGAIWLVRRSGPRRELALWALALIVAALIYVGFAVAGPGSDWIALEVLGLAVFGALAFFGWKVSPLFLAAGWLVHIGWDAALHPAGSATFVPGWYPSLCIGFDFAVGLYLTVTVSARPPGWSEVQSPAAD